MDIILVVSNSKSHPKESKVKKEEPVDDDDHDKDFKIPIKGSSSGSRPKATKLKKEESDDEDEKPISKRNFTTKEDKVFDYFLAFFSSKRLFFLFAIFGKNDLMCLMFVSVLNF